jgi:hypothetical protein
MNTTTAINAWDMELALISSPDFFCLAGHLLGSAG